MSRTDDNINLVEVHWTRRPRENYHLCLYAYLHSNTKRILYIGMAGRLTVGERMSGRHKKELFGYLYEEFGLKREKLLTIQGELELAEGARRSKALVSDVESLLIKRLKPLGNIKARDSRISRPGLRVRCLGDWPYHKSVFRDVG